MWYNMILDTDRKLPQLYITLKSQLRMEKQVIDVNAGGKQLSYANID